TMYRDFMYLDTDRLQSIIAQLEKGVLEQVLEGKTKELQGKASIAARILASFLPIGLEGSATRKTEVQHSKVLHDYAFTVALEALDKNGLFFEITDTERSQLPQTNAAFVLVRRSASILDYGLLNHLAKNEAMLNAMFAPQQNALHQTASNLQPNRNSQRGRAVPNTATNQPSELGVIQRMWKLVEAVMGDSLQIRLKLSDELLLVGSLSRKFLREDTRDFIFKYGGSPQSGWSMLGQIAQVTEPADKLSAFTEFGAKLQTSPKSFTTTTDAINPIVELLNLLGLAHFW